MRVCVRAETKDHLNWELIHEVAEKAKGEMRQTLKAADDEVEEEEDEALYLAGAALLYVAGLFQHFRSAFAGKATIAQLRPDTQADLDQVHRQPRGRLARIRAAEVSSSAGPDHSSVTVFGRPFRRRGHASRPMPT